MAKRCHAKVLQASTSEVYGDPQIHPQPESYRGSVNPIGPRACYDEGKRAAESLFMDYHRANRVNIRIARIFNTYGPRMHPYDGRVVSNFIRQALLGEDITIFGDGTQTRSFCFRDDMVGGLIRLMRSAGRFHRAGEPGQSGRVHHSPVGRTCDRADCDRLETDRGAVADRRSDAATPRHHAGQTTAKLASDNSAARRIAANDRLVPFDPAVGLPPADAELLRRTSVCLSVCLFVRLSGCPAVGGESFRRRMWQGTAMAANGFCPLQP